MGDVVFTCEAVVGESEAGVGHVAASVNEGDEFRWISFEGFPSERIAIFRERLDVFEQSDLSAGLLKPDWGQAAAGLAGEFGGRLSLQNSAIIDGLSFEVILITAEAPIAQIVLVEVLSCGSEALDDLLVGEAVVDQAIDLVAQGCGEAGDFAVAAALGLAGLELKLEVVLGGVGDEGGGHDVLGVRRET